MNGAGFILLFFLAQGVLSLAETSPRDLDTLISAEQNVLDQPFIIVESLPTCEENEFVTFNGSQLLCQTLPERVCNCPEIPPPTPQGCQRFSPPPRGGFVCLTTEDTNGNRTIYCSVQCDNTSEFSAFPLNPYRCGPETKFLWMDFLEETHKELPKCDNIRLSRQSIFPELYYLSVPCDHLTEDEQNRKFEDLLLDLQWIYRCSDCRVDQAYIQCP